MTIIHYSCFIRITPDAFWDVMRKNLNKVFQSIMGLYFQLLLTIHTSHIGMAYQVGNLRYYKVTSASATSVICSPNK